MRWNAALGIGALALMLSLNHSVARAELPGKPLCPLTALGADAGVKAAQAPNTWGQTCTGAKTDNPFGTATQADVGVLFAGGIAGSGPLKSAQLYIPAARGFVRAQPMAFARRGHTLTKLVDGRVLAAGGGNRVAEIFSSLVSANVDPALLMDAVSVGSFVKTGTMALDRVGHTATLLLDGKVLLAGGSICGGNASYACTTAAAELFDPAFDTFSPTGPLMSRVTGHAAAVLTGGRVLIVGGTIGGAATDIAQLYNPLNGTFSYAGTMTTPRRNPQAVTLTDGRVLIGGGDTGSLEIYNPSTGRFIPTGVWLPSSVYDIAPLGSGKALIILNGSNRAKVYDAKTGYLYDSGPYLNNLGLFGATVGAAITNGRYVLLNGGGGAGQVYQP